MNPLGLISEQALKEGLQFLVAGGHAVIIHGHQRNTFDLDLIIRRSDKERWTQLAQALGYSFHHEGPTFLQFNPKDQRGLPLDLMIVNDETFKKMRTEAVPATSSVPAARAVSLLHLLALKCHAIRYGHAGRIVKDADDVIQLVQLNGIDPNDANTRELFLKHGTKTCMKKSKGSAQKNEVPTLEFPDWSGMDDRGKRIDAEAAFNLPEQYPLWFPKLKSRTVKETKKCTQEFVL